MKAEQYLLLKDFLLEAGYAGEIQWAETVGPPRDSWAFFCEYAWVVINSGMRNQIARKIWEKVRVSVEAGFPVSRVFGHKGKAGAIQGVWMRRKFLWSTYLAKPDNKKLAYLQTLPWIGLITKYHLAKNLGMDVCKPDRHLVRIADQYGKTPEELCSVLAQATGDRIGTVDYVVWRSANLGRI